MGKNKEQEVYYAKPSNSSGKRALKSTVVKIEDGKSEEKIKSRDHKGHHRKLVSSSSSSSTDRGSHKRRHSGESDHSWNTWKSVLDHSSKKASVDKKEKKESKELKYHLDSGKSSSKSSAHKEQPQEKGKVEEKQMSSGYEPQSYKFKVLSHLVSTTNATSVSVVSDNLLNIGSPIKREHKVGEKHHMDTSPSKMSLFKSPPPLPPLPPRPLGFQDMNHSIPSGSDGQNQFSNSFAPCNKLPTFAPGTSKTGNNSAVTYMNGGQGQSKFKQPAPVTTCKFFSYLEHLDNYKLEKEDASVIQDWCLLKADKTKKMADAEEDYAIRQMMNFEAALYFILNGEAMVLDDIYSNESSFNIYKDAIGLFRQIALACEAMADEVYSTIVNKLVVLNLRCQSLLYLHMFKLEKSKVSDILKPHLEEPEVVNKDESSNGFMGRFNNPPPPEGPLHVGGSPKPSPDLPSVALQSPQAKLQTQNSCLINLAMSQKLWEQADTLIISSRSRGFFLRLDQKIGPLTLHSPLSHLVNYVKEGIQQLKNTPKAFLYINY